MRSCVCRLLIINLTRLIEIDYNKPSAGSPRRPIKVPQHQIVGVIALAIGAAGEAAFHLVKQLAFVF